MAYLKHSGNNGAGKRAKAAKAKAEPVNVVLTGPDDSKVLKTPSMQHDVNYVRGLDGIEESLDWIARGLEKLSSDSHSFGLSSCYTDDPVKITFADNDYEDTMGRLVTAVERIADSLGRIAGLNRPRLESWHEQEMYTPRYKELDVDGGAPGPKQSD